MNSMYLSPIYKEHFIRMRKALERFIEVAELDEEPNIHSVGEAGAICVEKIVELIEQDVLVMADNSIRSDSNE